MFYKCERCDRDSVLTNVHALKLAGGVQSALCSRCATEWDEAFKAQPVMERFRALKVKEHLVNAQAAAGRAPVEEELAALVEEAREIEVVWHEFGKQFVNTKPDWANAV